MDLRKNGYLMLPVVMMLVGIYAVDEGFVLFAIAITPFIYSVGALDSADRERQ